MTTLYRNFLSGTTSDNPLAIGATTVNSAGFASLPVVSGGARMWLVLDPTGASGAPEIVEVTGHTAASTTVTVTRGAQSTTARSHAQNTSWVVAPTQADLDELPFRRMTTTGDMLYASAANVVSRLGIGTAGQTLVVSGGVPAWGQAGTAAIADLAVTTAKIADSNVTTAKIADGAITSAKIADGTIATGDIADGAITSAKILNGTIGTDDIADGAVTAAKLAGTIANMLLPAGVTMGFLGTTAPSGWLFHNQTVTNAQTLFPSLWANTPVSWRSGSNLIIPDLTDTVLAQTGGSAAALGAIGGSMTVTLAEANLPPHAHAPGTLATSAHSVSDPGHGHGVSDPQHQHGQNVVANGIGSVSTRADWTIDTTTGGILAQTGVATNTAATGISINGNTTGISVAAHTISGSTGNGPGTSTAVTVRPRHLGVNIIIKAH